MDVCSLFYENSRNFPDKPAVVEGSRICTFYELNSRINRLIKALTTRGIGSGDRIAVLSRNRAEYFDLYGAALKGGGILVPLNYRLSSSEIAELINGVEAKGLVFEETYRPVVEELRDYTPSLQTFICIGKKGSSDYDCYEEFIASASPGEPEERVDPAAVCYVMHTSGTTGLPKGAMLSHRGQMANALSMIVELGLHPEDRMLNVLPFYHLGGWVDALCHLVRGCTNFVMPEFDPSLVLETIERHKITSLALVPTLLYMLLDAPEISKRDKGSLRTILYSGSPIATELLLKAINVFGYVFIQPYGQTETGPLVSVLTRNDHHRAISQGRPELLKSCGRPAIGVAVRLVNDLDIEVHPGEVGEIIATSDFIMSGYWGNPALTEETLRGGWVHTGDLAKVDEEGYIYLVDRKKDVVMSGGEKIYARQVEETILSHPAVQETAVIGIPDEKWGERLKAFVVLEEDGRVSTEEIIRFCKERLASFKSPKVVEFRDSLPKSPTGKILKWVLREESSQ